MAGEILAFPRAPSARVERFSHACAWEATDATSWVRRSAETGEVVAELELLEDGRARWLAGAGAGSVAPSLDVAATKVSAILRSRWMVVEGDAAPLAAVG